MKRWPVNKAWFWETTPFLRLLLPLMAGVLVYYYFGSIFSREVLIALLALPAIAIITTGFAKQKLTLVKSLFTTSVYTAIFSASLLFCYLNDIRNNENWFGRHLDADVFIARIADQPAEKDRTWKLKVDVINTIAENQTAAVIGKAFVYIYKGGKSIHLQEGDTIMLPAKWQRMKNAGNAFEFDYAGYCARHNIYYQQFLNEKAIKIYAKSSKTDISWIRHVHNLCMTKLVSFINDKSTLGLIQAMLIGDEVNFDPELRQAYSETGIIHVVAISGSHITAFFVLIAFMLAWIKNRKHQWLKYVIAIPLVWAYVLIAGAPPSAVRAATMFTILGLGFALQKSPNSLNQLFASAFILLCAEPMWLFSVGFQLSFLAVLSLILFYRPIYKLLSPAHFITKAIWASIAASIAAEILIAPLVIYYFHIFPLMFIVANVIAYLFMGIVLVLGMLIVTMPVPAIAAILSSITIWLVIVFNKMVFALRQLNPRSFYFLDLKSYELVLVFIIITAIAVFVLRKQKRGLFISLAGLCLLLCSFCINEWNALHQRKLVVYNISKANHIELIDGKRHLVLATDTNISKRKKSYALKPAHTGWHAWRKKNTKPLEILSINGKSVLILNQMQKYAGVFQVDYLVINFNVRKTQPSVLMQTFQPKALVLGCEVSRRKAEEWGEICEKQGISLHNVLLDGAFVL